MSKAEMTVRPSQSRPFALMALALVALALT